MGKIENLAGGWLEMKHTHFHGGDKVSLPFVPADKHKSDFPPKHSFVNAVGPNGQAVSAEYTAGESKTTVGFEPETDGYYRVCLGLELTGDKEKGQKCFLYAQSVMAVGHHINGEIPGLECPLEIGFADWHSWQTGDTLKLRILRMGVPVPDCEINFVNQTFTGEMNTIKTSADGRAEITFEKPGSYVCSVVSVANEGDIMSASLHIMVMKKR